MTTGGPGWADDLHREPTGAALLERPGLSVDARTPRAYPLPK